MPRSARRPLRASGRANIQVKQWQTLLTVVSAWGTGGAVCQPKWKTRGAQDFVLAHFLKPFCGVLIDCGVLAVPQRSERGVSGHAVLGGVISFGRQQLTGNGIFLPLAAAPAALYRVSMPPPPHELDARRCFLAAGRRRRPSSSRYQ